MLHQTDVIFLSLSKPFKADPLILRGRLCCFLVFSFILTCHIYSYIHCVLLYYYVLNEYTEIPANLVVSMFLTTNK